MNLKRDLPKKCWLCGGNGNGDPLELHHCFGASNRKKSDQLGLFVYLCGNSCHRNGPEAAHSNADTMRKLHQYGQQLAMERFGWDVDDFRREFGKNYLPEEPEGGAVMAYGFTVLEDAALPY